MDPPKQVRVSRLMSDLTSFNIYVINIAAPNYTKTTLMDLKAQIDPNTATVGDLSAPLSPVDRSSRQKFNKETSELIGTLDQMDVIDI
jgi:hypothetical protein